MFKLNQVSAICLFFSLSLLACKKSDNADPGREPGPDPAPPVTITTAALKAKGGGSVEIKGTGFSTVVSENQVTINDQSVEVISASSTTLQVKVPSGIGDGKMKIKVRNQLVDGPDFRYEWMYTVSTITLSGIVPMVFPGDMEIDNNGNLYVLESSKHRVKKINTTGVVTVYAGSPEGYTGSTDANGIDARFSNPSGINMAPNGELYVADWGNLKTRVIALNRNVSTIPMQECIPLNLALRGNKICVADKDNHKVFEFTNATDAVSIYDASGFAPKDIDVDASNNLFVVDANKHHIVKFDGNNSKMIWAGSEEGKFGVTDGIGTAARFDNINAITVDKKGYIYVAENSNRIRMIYPDRTVITIAGNGTKGSSDGAGTAATFFNPSGIAVDNNGVVYIADRGNNVVRKITRQ